MKSSEKRYGLKIKVAACLLAMLMLFSLMPFSSLAANDMIVYFAAPNTGTGWSDYDEIQFNLQYGGRSDERYPATMTDTGFIYNGLKVYSIELDSSAVFKWHGYHKLQFQAYKNGAWKAQVEYNSSETWRTDQATWNGKIFYNGSWVEYTPPSNEFDDSKAQTIYFNATLSSLQYWNNDLGNADGADYTDADWASIPNSYADGGLIYYYASGTAGNQSGTLTSLGDNLYSVALEENKGDKIVFSSQPLSALVSNTVRGGSTDVLDVPQDMTEPCFYADTGDDSVYARTARSGYWAQKGLTIDAEAYKDGAEIVDVPTGTFTKNSSTLYLSSTLYDYYSDYEINGYNRDDYNVTANEVLKARYRRWAAFRQFNQALSSEYSAKSVAAPVYVGHFQSQFNGGAMFSNIAGSVNLYGYNGSAEGPFMSVNDSSVNYDNAGGYYAYASQGIVASQLTNGNIYTATGSLLLPYFNESFLAGNNSKNTVLGTTYSDVAMPLTLQAETVSVDGDDCQVYYWKFDSDDTTLTLKRDPSKGYFLDEVTSSSEKNKYRNVDGSMTYSNSGLTSYGFLPFNSGATADKGDTYNFGFGLKTEFKFKLNSSGTVAVDDTHSVPIIFEFTGDDDLWIFIDGKLALDVGGDHAKVTGSLNFRDLTATVSAVKKSVGNSGVTEGAVTSSFELTGGKAGEHTMTIFYIERGMFESNLMLKFNFPDENKLTIEKQIDTTDVDSRFADLVDDGSFSYTVKTLATHYGTWSGKEATGFINQKDIKDFGTATGTDLACAEGAKYTVYNSSTEASVSTGTLPSTGELTLEAGRYAEFKDQFRKGSYLYIKEEMTDAQSKLYSCTYTVYGADGTPVTSMSTGDYVTNGSVTSLQNVSGTTVNDGRSENKRLEFQESSGDNAYQRTASATRPTEALLFRSYSDPDATAGETELKIVFTNIVKVGTLKVYYRQAEGSIDLTGTTLFDINFTDVGGANLGTVAVTSDSLAKDGSYTVSGIPAGTSYTITEGTATDGSRLVKVDSEAGATSASGTISVGVTSQHTFYNFLKETESSLTITKTVSGSMGNKAYAYEFTLKLTGYKLDPVPEGLTDASGEGADGIYTFTLSHGDSITISLPIGTAYEITEKVLTGYSVTINGEASAGGKISGTVVNNTPITVAYTNMNDGVVPTGVDLASGAPLLMSAAAGLAALIALRKKKEN